MVDKVTHDKIDELLAHFDGQDFSDAEYCEALEELVEKVQTALDAKREEMDKDA